MVVLARACRALVRLADALAGASGWLSMAFLVVLVVTMTVEVFMRRVIGSPTDWAYDVAWMSNGAVFVLAVAVVLRERRHIAIDFLAMTFPSRLRAAIDAIFFGLLLTPLFVFLAHVAWAEAIDAMMTGRVDRVSPWAPKLWPYMSALAVGLTALALECLATALRTGERALAGVGQPSSAPSAPPPDGSAPTPAAAREVARP